MQYEMLNSSYQIFDATIVLFEMNMTTNYERQSSFDQNFDLIVCNTPTWNFCLKPQIDGRENILLHMWVLFGLFFVVDIGWVL